MATDLSILPAIEPRPEFADILKQTVTFSRGRPDEVGDRVNGWFDRLMLQSGIRVSPTAWLMLSVLLAVALGGSMFVLTERLVLSVVCGLVGLVAPVGTAVIKRHRRQKKITEQMPAAIEELARAARTGRSIESCLRLVADDTPAPLGDELELASRKTLLGVSIGEAVAELPVRTGVLPMQMLTTALAVHRETGGDLVSVLERLAASVRDRLHFTGRLRAATAASRATAVLMLVLPPLIVGFFVFRDPAYFVRLMSSKWGLFSFWTAVALQLIGTVAVLRIVRRTGRA